MAKLPDLPPNYRWRIGTGFESRPYLYLERQSFTGWRKKKEKWTVERSAAFFPHIFHSFEKALLSTAVRLMEEDTKKLAEEADRLRKIGVDLAMTQGKYGVYSGGSEV